MLHLDFNSFTNWTIAESSKWNVELIFRWTVENKFKTALWANKSCKEFYDQGMEYNGTR